MTAYKGSMLLLKAGDGGIPTEQFITIGGLRNTRLAINRQPVTHQDMANSGWRQVREGAGIAQMRIQGQGIFTDSEGENVLRAQSINGLGRNYRICFGNGDVLQGRFVVSAYERAGKTGDAEAFSLTLESAGPVVLTPA